MTARRAILCADDFGLTEGVNEAVELAYRQGVLTAASLMVSAPAAADAVRRARAMPGLRVGLHLVLVEGRATLPSAWGGLVDRAGWFPSAQGRLGLAFARPSCRPALAAEIAAQYAAFAATGLPLDHVNAHKHMHLHPVVGALAIGIGRAHGLRAIRVPREPAAVLRLAGSARSASSGLALWCALLRRRALAAGLVVPDSVFGLAWSGHMTASRLARLASVLPPGLTEIYTHPAAHADASLRALMPDYEPVAELAALLDPAVRAAFGGVPLIGYADAGRPPAAARRRASP